MKYQILPYTEQKALELGVKVYASDNPKYKLEVYDWNGNFITYCGANGYYDYPHYLKDYGRGYANYRRKLYKQRHEKDRHKVGSRGYYADNLLW
jgi:hypothetical protein